MASFYGRGAIMGTINMHEIFTPIRKLAKSFGVAVLSVLITVAGVKTGDFLLKRTQKIKIM